MPSKISPPPLRDPADSRAWMDWFVRINDLLTKLDRGEEFIHEDVYDDVASVDLSTYLDSTKYYGYMLRFRHLRVESAGADIYLQISQASTWRTTGYGGATTAITDGAATTLVDVTSTSGAMLVKNGSITESSTAMGYALVPNANGTGEDKKILVNFAYKNNAAEQANVSGSAVYIGNQAAIDGLRIQASTGNIRTNVHLYGYRIAPRN